MLIMPAIDLKDGRCVRLAQGRFDSATIYGDPFAQLEVFASAGAAWVHIVDLDGARLGLPEQHDLVRRLAKATSLKVQAGGGVKARDDVERLLLAGVARVVVGSTAVRAPHAVQSWMNEFGAERICCAFDVRSAGMSALAEVAIGGWTQNGGITLGGALSLFPRYELKHILVTDIARDGVLAGPNTKLIADLVAMRPDLKVQASGGVASLADLDALRAVGASATIVGRALYERSFALEDALAG